MYVRNVKQVVNYGLELKKVHRFLKFIQKAQLKPYIDIECRAEKKAKTEFFQVDEQCSVW